MNGKIIWEALYVVLLRVKVYLIQFNERNINKKAQLVNEGKVSKRPFKGDKIEKIGNHLSINGNEEIIDASGLYLLPGWIDDWFTLGSQV